MKIKKHDKRGAFSIEKASAKNPSTANEPRATKQTTTRDMRVKGG